MHKKFVTALLLALVAPLAQAGALLDDYLRLQLGSFSSEVQARHDSRYGVAIWHFAEIWPGSQADERWVYTESWIKDAERPYMQRISRLTANVDGEILAQRYTIPDAGRFVGAWKSPDRFSGLDRGDLVELTGCAAVIVRAGKDRFEGGTSGTACRNEYKGAAYAISRLILTADDMTNWDRGFSRDGQLVWGPASGGYRFRRAGEEGACVDPVRMLVYGTIEDRKAFGPYGRALAESGLYPKNGGWYEAITPPLDVFEGAPPDTRGVIIARFPCLEAARRFWNSPEYTGIRKLREGIAEFEVLVLPVPPLPEWAD